MILSMKGLLKSWEYGRGIVLKFIVQLSDEDLDKELPRKNYNTIRLQVEELARIQSYYVNAMSTGKMSFGGNPVQDKSKQGIISIMAELDEQLEKALNALDGNETINWHGEQMDIHEHVSAMIGHEQMHIGQIIAFCYAAGIHIPDDITNIMSLDG
ncbi:MAG: DinB family protein [Defluviitaleaceae bacterium]|nr:DinB family protein [Defluviitaleaceae bacterium]MCL2836146.1 DinB family protein [Defluviitaleaceae bacterium]